MRRNKKKAAVKDELGSIEELAECLLELNRSVVGLQTALQNSSLDYKHPLEIEHENIDDVSIYSSADTIDDLSSEIQMTPEETRKLTKKPTLH